MRIAGKLAAVVVTVSFSVACGGMVDSPVDGQYSAHEEASDFEPAAPLVGKADDVAPIFDADHIVSDAFFRDSDAMSAAQIQAFLDSTPYGNRSWLAAEVVDGRSLAQVIADTSVEYSLNPMMILSRFQVEGSHISTSRHPGNRSASRALGCGCFDGQQCRSAYLGLGKQVACAADTLDKRFRGSADGSWAWRRGVTKSTLDGIRVTPANHATAALYAYTPWVLRGRGGNWLVWNITKRFVGHAPDSGTIGTTTPEASAINWVGKPCTTDAQCDFADGENFGFCYDFADPADGSTKGFCSLVCEGFCPDRHGTASTFCVEADVGGVGICASKSESANGQCAAIPGTTPTNADRFVGESTAGTSSADVCLPPG